MAKNTFLLVQMNLVEVVHIELPDEGAKTIVPEITRKHSFFQFFLIEDPDSFGLGVPGDSFGMLFWLVRMDRYFKNIVEFIDKGGGFFQVLHLKKRLYFILLFFLSNLP